MGLAAARKQGRRSGRTMYVKLNGVPTKADVDRIKQEADLLVWAADAVKGQPQEAKLADQAKKEKTGL